MRWRPPRFTLLLTGLVAVAAAAIVLLGGRGASQAGGGPRQIATGGRERACMTTEAEARDTARGVITATGTATAPMRVSQTVVGPRAVVTVTRGGLFKASVRASRHLSVTQRSVARSRDCAAGPSLTAARGLALRKAYALARARARAEAAAGARGGLRVLERRTYPLVAEEARAAAGQRAQALALAARPALIREARRQAIRRAGA